MGTKRRMVFGISIVVLISTVTSLAISALAVYLTSGDGRNMAEDMKYALSLSLVIPPIVSAPVTYVLLKQREQIRKISEELAYSLKYDALTGLFTRRAFCNHVEKRLAKLNKSSDPFAMFFIDLDRFKKINDQFGHMTGDEVLRIFGRLMNNCLKEGEVAGRMGGEEFCLFIEGCSAFEAEVRARQLAEAFSVQARHVNGKLVEATLSSGVYATNSQIDLDSLLNKADELLYVAKENGRNRVIVGHAELVEADEKAIA